MSTAVDKPDPDQLPPLKSLFRSKTFWVNAISGASAVCAIIAGSELIAEHPRVVSSLWLASAVLGILLRLASGEPVTMRFGAAKVPQLPFKD